MHLFLDQSNTEAGMPHSNITIIFFQIIMPEHHHMTLHQEIPVLDKQGNLTFENLFTNCQNKIKRYSQKSLSRMETDYVPI